LYWIGILSGLTDVDAITLSTAQLVNGSRITPDVGWRIILCAALANLVFKLGVVAFLGGVVLLQKILAYFVVNLLGGALILWLGPDYFEVLIKP
jgi:uncharacterized membrane protein (DUF4010 family)